MGWEKNLLLIGIGFLLTTIIVNGYYIYHIIIPQDCYASKLGETISCDNKSYFKFILTDNKKIDSEIQLGKDLITNQTVIVTEDLPQVQFYSNLKTGFLWSAKNKSDVLKGMDKLNSDYYFVLSASNNTIKNLAPEFVLVKTYHSIYRTQMLFKRVNENSDN